MTEEAGGFRSMRDEEADAVVALWRDCGLTRPWNDADADIALARRGDASDILVLVDEAGLAAAFMIGHDGHRAWVYYLAVAPERRRAGLGAAAMAAAERWARTHGLPKLHLMVRRGNVAAVAFYEALGYETDETRLMVRWLDDQKGALWRAGQTKGDD